MSVHLAATSGGALPRKPSKTCFPGLEFERNRLQAWRQVGQFIYFFPSLFYTMKRKRGKTGGKASDLSRPLLSSPCRAGVGGGWGIQAAGGMSMKSVSAQRDTFIALVLPWGSKGRRSRGRRITLPCTAPLWRYPGTDRSRAVSLPASN